MNESDNEEFILEETSYEITPEGSSFQNCTPSILGPQYDRILSLDYSQMWLIKIAVVYIRNPYEGNNIPSIILTFRSGVNRGDNVFHIKCRMGCISDSCRFEQKRIPDMNAFTAFTESASVMELKMYSNYCPRYHDGILDSTITLKDNYGNCLAIECIDFKFEFEN